MTSLQQVLDEATLRLQQAGVDSPRLDAQLLLAHVLQVERTYLLAHPEQALTPEQQERCHGLLARRLHREPLAYITGRRWFYGLELTVTPAVLIPRPETEQLVETALAWLEQRAHTPLWVADIGTGSGAIAVALAVHTPSSVHIVATDVSPQALEVARANAREHRVEHRIDFRLGDTFEPLGEPVDLILANLPYVAEEDREQLMPEVRDYEPALALFAGRDGLDVLTPFLEQAPRHLRPQGAILLEIGYLQGPTIRRLARRAFPRARIRLHRDLAGLQRLLEVQT
ncbi:MAG: peptide chain release factor N(5)-glutamine methyltransferase [Caldilineae bacterium]|nr:MAG: peptide chain release factor N(5)-glutamine methyltransferase [Caldilineae bacterium]